MARHRSTRRLTRPSASEAETALPLVSLLAETERLTDVLAQLHQRTLEDTGGRSSLLFEHNPRTGVLQATSGFAVDTLQTDPWPGDDEDRLLPEIFAGGVPMLVADLERQLPELALLLAARSALLIPLLRRGEPVGLVTVGFADAPDAADLGDLGDLQQAFLVTLELFRLRDNERLHHETRDLIDTFSATLTASASLEAGLAQFCVGATQLFAADRASVWIHDRRSRQLRLQATSDPSAASDVPMSVDDPYAPAAIALRNLRAELSAGSVEGELDTVTVPLRGRRRALGTLVFDGVRIEPGGELDVLDRADEVGRELSSAIDTMQLLDEVIRARHAVDTAFNTLGHMLVVIDRAGRIIHSNDRFAARAGLAREQLADRLLSEVAGSELASWVTTVEVAESGGEHRRMVDQRLGGPLDVTVTLLRGPGGPVGRVVIARDGGGQPETKRN